MAQDEAGTSPATAHWAIVAELASMTAVWRRLLEDHVPTPLGRCRACTQGGTGIPAARWPCGPRTMAEAAARWHAGHRTDQDSA